MPGLLGVFWTAVVFLPEGLLAITVNFPLRTGIPSARTVRCTLNLTASPCTRGGCSMNNSTVRPSRVTLCIGGSLGGWEVPDFFPCQSTSAPPAAANMHTATTKIIIPAGDRRDRKGESCGELMGPSQKVWDEGRSQEL